MSKSSRDSFWSWVEKTSAMHTANAVLFTLVETAKENNLDVYEYLKYLLEEMPNNNHIQHPEVLKRLGTIENKYAYDEIGQMNRENDADKNITKVYTYNTGGNLTSLKESVYTTGTLGSVLNTINYGYGVPTGRIN